MTEAGTRLGAVELLSSGEGGFDVARVLRGMHGGTLAVESYEGGVTRLVVNLEAGTSADLDLCAADVRDLIRQLQLSLKGL